VLLGAVILFFSLIRVRLLNFPLERDEGEYAYSGQLMLQGIAPYSLAYTMKLPGTFAAYALVMAVFGQSPAGIHAGLLLVNAATAILMFLLANRLFGPLAGLAAGASYALLSTSESVLGLAAHATDFVVLPELGGILVLLKALESERMSRYFVSGLLLGSAFVCKQPGLFFGLFGAFLLIVTEWRGEKDWRRLTRHVAVYSAGALTPFALTCGILVLAGSAGKMWFWTFSYGTQYASALTWSEAWQQFVAAAPAVVEAAPLVWILAAIGLVFAWNSGVSQNSVFTIGFLLFSWAAVCPGFYFRPHYFILLLPAVCLLVGVAIGSVAGQLSLLFRNAAATAIPLLVLVGAMAVSVAGQSQVFFHLDPLAACRYIYGTNPFPEAQVISEYLNRHAAPDARIAVIGSEPEIYFYSRRHSATGYIYTYPLVEAQKFAVDMQEQMAKEIEDSHPEYMVFVQVPSSWRPRPGSSTFIFEWFRKYAAAHYEIVGIADEVTPETLYVWDDSAKSYRTQSEEFIEVFRRKTN